MEGRRAPVAAENTDLKPSVPTETLAEGSRRRTSSQKRKAASNISAVASAYSSYAPKRFVKERSAISILSSGHNGPCTRARQLPGKLTAESPQPPEEGVAIVDAMVGEAGKEIVLFEDPVKSVDEAAEIPDVPTVDEDFEAVRSRGVGVHVVPTSAGWFSWEKIQELEKNALPSFFNGHFESKTPEIYMEIRNSIMTKFHLNPQTTFELKDLSEISAGELAARQEVMEFLDYWGLINFHPLPNSTTDARVPEAIDEKTCSLLDQLYRFENTDSLSCYAPKKQESSPPSMLPYLLPESTLLDDTVRPVDPSVEYHCNSCSADCSRKRYHCQKQADFDLCAECYNDGKFGFGMISADFILMESAEGPGVSSRSWTDQETLLLLEALELFGENWIEIAEHVATKTKAQCILHFLQMAIEDPFLENKEDGTDPCSAATVESFAANAPEAMELENGVSSNQPIFSPADVSDRKDAVVYPSVETHSDFALNALKSAFQATGFMIEEGRPFSFAEAGNPAMVLAAFLARLVDEDAVTTSSRNSLKSLSEEYHATQLVSRHCFILEDPPNDSKSPVPESAVTAIDDGEPLKEEPKLASLNCSIELNNESKNDTQPNLTSGSNEMEQLASSTVKESRVSSPPVNAVSGSIGHSDDDNIPMSEEQTSQPDRKDASNFEELRTSEEEKPKSVEQSEYSELIDQTQQISKVQKVEDVMLTSIVLREEELQQKDSATSTFDVNEVAGAIENKTSSPNTDVNISTVSESPHTVNSLKRAAVSVLSAASVKAKLLADREEDQIRQLVSCVIEKQLCKMEVKLAFFPDMENLMLRAKAQTERARQKLFNERSQIIAARLGFSQSSSSRPYINNYNAALAASLANPKLHAMGSGSVRPPSIPYQRPPPPSRRP